MPGPRRGPAYTRNSHADAHVIVAGAHAARYSRRPASFDWESCESIAAVSWYGIVKKEANE